MGTLNVAGDLSVATASFHSHPAHVWCSWKLYPEEVRPDALRAFVEHSLPDSYVAELFVAQEDHGSTGSTAVYFTLHYVTAHGAWESDLQKRSRKVGLSTVDGYRVREVLCSCRQRLASATCDLDDETAKRLARGRLEELQLRVPSRPEVRFDLGAGYPQRLGGRLTLNAGDLETFAGFQPPF